MGHNTLIAAGSALVQFLSKDYRDFLSAGFTWHKVSKDYFWLKMSKLNLSSAVKLLAFAQDFHLRIQNINGNINR